MKPEVPLKSTFSGIFSKIIWSPFCGISTPGECLNSKDLASIVGMDFSEDIFGNLIRKSRHRSKELEVRPISTQTEESQKLGLEERLQMIDQGNVFNFC